MNGHAVITGRILLPESPESPDSLEVPAEDVPVRQCGRCGAVGTHYLTCPALRLPAGYRISDPDRRPRQ